MITTSKPIVTESNFIFTIPGQNLEEQNIVFLVKRIVQRFLEEFEFLVTDDIKKLGRHKDYETDDLLGLIVLGVLNNVTSCRGLEKWVKDNNETCVMY